MDKESNRSLVAAAKRILLGQVRQWMEPKQSEPFYRLDLDLLQVANDEALLFEFIVGGDLEDACWVFQEAIAEELTQSAADNDDTGELTVEVRFVSVPSRLPGLDILSYRDFPNRGSRDPRPVQRFRGILGAISSRVEYIRGAKVTCSWPQCQGPDSDAIFRDCCIKIRVPGGDNQPVPLLCPICSAPMEENVCERDVSHHITAIFYPTTSMTTVLGGIRHQGVRVLIRDENVESLLLGEAYELYGHVVFPNVNSDQCVPMIECLYIRPQPHWASDFYLTRPLYLLPQLDSFCPWQMVQRLTYHFGSEITAPGTLRNLKMGILLSLAAASSKVGDERSAPHLSLLVAGFDVILAQRLLQYSLNFVNRSVLHSSNSADMCASKCKDALSSVPVVEAGSLLLARGGVCYLGDLNQYKKSGLEKLATALEREAVIATSAENDSSVSYPLNCTVWATNALTVPKKERADGKHILEGRNIPDVMKRLKEVFRLVYVIEESSAGNELSIPHVMKQRSETTRTDISTADYKKFLQQVRNRSVTMEAPSLQLLKRYFVASRRWRHVATGRGSEMTQASLKTLSLLAEAHAKLSLRESVSLTDALAAIRLFEETLSLQGGCSFLMEGRTDLLANCTEREALIKYEEDMSSTWKKLQDFIQYYSSDVTFEEVVNV